MNNPTVLLMLCIVVLLAMSSGRNILQSCAPLQRIHQQASVVEEAALLRLRGGEAVTIGKKRKVKYQSNE